MRSLLILPAALLSAQSARAEPALFDSPPLDDAELADARGGFTLASGVTVDFGAMVTTSVDGVRVLQTDLQFTGNSVATAVFAAEGVSVTVADDRGTADGAGGQTYVNASIEMPDLAVRHMIGRQISSVIVNTGDNRIVDNQVAINLRLDNVDPLTIGSIGFRIQAIGLDAAAMRIP